MIYFYFYFFFSINMWQVLVWVQELSSEYNKQKTLLSWSSEIIIVIKMT